MASIRCNHLVNFLSQVATYSESGTIRRTIGSFFSSRIFLLTVFMSRMRMMMRGLSTSRAARVRNMIKPNRAHGEASAGLPSS